MWEICESDEVLLAAPLGWLNLFVSLLAGRTTLLATLVVPYLSWPQSGTLHGRSFSLCGFLGSEEGIVTSQFPAAIVYGVQWPRNRVAAYWQGWVWVATTGHCSRCPTCVTCQHNDCLCIAPSQTSMYHSLLPVCSGARCQMPGKMWHLCHAMCVCM